MFLELVFLNHSALNRARVCQLPLSTFVAPSIALFTFDFNCIASYDTQHASTVIMYLLHWIAYRSIFKPSVSAT